MLTTSRPLWNDSVGTQLRQLGFLRGHAGTIRGAQRDEVRVVAQVRKRENDAWTSAVREECTSVLTGAALSKAEAMDAIARIDDDTARHEDISRAVLADIGKRHGAELAAKLEARIVEQGDVIEFSKTHLVKSIPVTHDGDYIAWLQAECNAL